MTQSTEDAAIHDLNNDELSPDEPPNKRISHRTELLNESIVNALTVNAGKGCSNRNLMKYQQSQKSLRRFGGGSQRGGFSTRFKSQIKLNNRNSISEEKIYEDNGIDDEDGGGAANLLDARHLFMLEAKKASQSTFHLSQFEESMAQLTISSSWQDDDDDEKEKGEEVQFEDYEQPIMEDDKKIEIHQVKSHNRHNVKFTKVSIREYPMIVGVNPGGSQGVPVTIGWEKCNDDDMIVHIDQYENVRISTRRTKSETLRMTSSYRNDVLKKLGFSLQERQEGQKMATLIRKHRMKENLHEKNDAIYEKLEGARRSLNHFLHPKKYKKDLEFIRTSVSLGSTRSSQRSSMNSSVGGRSSMNSVGGQRSSVGGGSSCGGSDVDGNNSDIIGSSKRSSNASGHHQLHSILRTSITNQ